jgi:hypothetical protein
VGFRVHVRTRLVIDKEGPPNKFSISLIGGSSHRRKGTARHMIDTYGLAISLAYPSGEERGTLLV